MKKIEKEVFDENIDFLQRYENFSFRPVRGKGLAVYHDDNPDKLLGYINRKEYDASELSQINMVRDILGLKYDIVLENVNDWDSDYDIEMLPYGVNSSIGNNFDWMVIHGEGYYTDMDGSVSGRIDGRLDFPDSLELDIFWEDIGEFAMNIGEIDPDELYTVYHRKGKDWYIGNALSLIEMPIVFYDQRADRIVDLAESDIAFAVGNSDRKVYEAIYEKLLRVKLNLNVLGYLQNLIYYSPYRPYHSDLGFVPLSTNLDMSEGYNMIVDEVFAYIERDLGGRNTPKDYNYGVVCESITDKIICENLNDFDTSGMFEELRQIVANNQYGAKLVYSKVIDGAEDKSFAIKLRKHEYHFTTIEFFSTERDQVEDFFNDIIRKLQTRIKESKTLSDLKERAKKVFVSFEDSLKAGNCEFGTKKWLADHNISPDKIGGIRGDVLLEIDPSSTFVIRAVKKAVAEKLQ